jgi:phosphoglycerate dehydrogenase-like enzyme
VTEPVYQYERVLCLPHVGSTTTEVIQQFADWIADNVRRRRAGEPLLGQLADRAG